MINALNSGARVFMADFEDANSPTWENVVQGQANVRDAVRREITLDTAEKSYRLNDETATLIIRPRGWHLPERHHTIDGEPVSGEPLRLRARDVPQRARVARPRQRAVLLPAEARVAPRGAAVGGGVRARGGRARPAARLDPLHGADRDDPRRVRDGRDPLRASRLRVRAERGPLGLHLQLHQEVPDARLGAARPGAGDDGGAVHARVHRAARARRATGAARTRSAAWRRSSRRARTPR